MGTLKKFEEILAWQEARTLAKMVYDITRKGALANGLQRGVRARSRVSCMFCWMPAFFRRKILISSIIRRISVP